MLKNIKVNNKIKGDFGEEIVNRYLYENGYEILYRNYKCSFGEIDIIFKDGKEIVFAEIKSRNSLKYGRPSEAVTNIKRIHIYNTAKYFLYKNKLLNNFVRFDVIEVFLNYDKPLINHIKNVFW